MVCSCGRFCAALIRELIVSDDGPTHRNSLNLPGLGLFLFDLPRQVPKGARNEGKSERKSGRVRGGELVRASLGSGGRCDLQSTKPAEKSSRARKRAHRPRMEVLIVLACAGTRGRRVSSAE